MFNRSVSTRWILLFSLVLTLFLGCGEDNGINDFLYPYAPTLDLQLGRRTDDSIFYIVRARLPVPYAVSGQVYIHRLMNFREAAGGVVPWGINSTFTIGKGMILYSEPIPLTEPFKWTTTGPEITLVTVYAEHIEIELQPWSGPGDNPYNVGKGTLEYRP